MYTSTYNLTKKKDTQEKPILHKDIDIERFTLIH